MKVLILSCNTGSGSNAVGHAIYEEFHFRNIPCTYLDILSFVPEKKKKHVTKVAVNYYYQLIASRGDFLGFTDSITHPLTHSRLLSLGQKMTEGLAEYIIGDEATVVITTHLFSAAALSYLKKHHRLTIPFYAVSTECDVLDVWKKLNPDAVFTVHKDFSRYFMKSGLSHDRIYPFGIPLPRAYNNRIPMDEARRSLNMPEDGKMVLLMDNALRSSELKKLFSSLRQLYGPRLLVTILSDQSNASRHNDHPSTDERLYYRSNLDALNLYLDASDLFITRPVGLFPAFSAVKRIPTLLTHPYPGLSLHTAKFYHRIGAAHLISSLPDLLDSSRRYIEDKESRDNMNQAQMTFLRPGIASDLCSFILENPLSSGATDSYQP